MISHLHRTWALLAVAAMAVSGVLFVAGRDLREDVYPVRGERSVFHVDASGRGILSIVPSRRFEPEGALSGRHLPFFIAVLAAGALAFAAARSRRGIVYATRLHRWTEGELGAGGRIVARGTGQTLGVTAALASRRFVPGPVLVRPERDAEAGALYRENRMLERGDLAPGSHARWRDATMRGLRDARALAVVSAACAAAAFVARVLGG